MSLRRRSTGRLLPVFRQTGCADRKAPAQAREPAGPLNPRRLAPAPSAVVADPQSAVVRVLPRAHVNRGGVGGVDHDAVENKAVGAAQLRQPMPGCAFVHAIRRANCWSCREGDASAGLETMQTRAHRRPPAPRRSRRFAPASRPRPAKMQRIESIAPEPQPGTIHFEHTASGSFRQDSSLASLSRIDNFGAQNAKRLTSLCTGQPHRTTGGMFCGWVPRPPRMNGCVGKPSIHSRK